MSKHLSLPIKKAGPTGFRILLVLLFLLSLISSSPTPAHAASNWIAYNDCQNISTSPADKTTNITTVLCSTNSTGNTLKNYANNSVVSGITFDVAVSGTIDRQNSNSTWGAVPTGGDAVTVFNPYVTMRGGERLGSADATVKLTFKGLSPSKTYAFATSANRAGGSDYANRLTTFTISGVDAATNTSSSGTTASGYTTKFSTGENTTNGYIARWEGINPGSDGTFVVTASNQNSGSNNPYGPAVFLIAEEITGPVINVSGTMSAFDAPLGGASSAQTYTVSGANLTAPISISAPAGFELSKDGSSYSSSLSLDQTGGAIASTTVYVRLSGSALGPYSGKIAHTSAGASAVDLAVSGTVAKHYSLTANATSGGSIALNPAGGSYAEGTVVTLTATANSGFAFSGWSGNIASSTNPTTITMDADKTVTANFVAGTCATANLVATEDTYLSSVNTKYNYGGVNLFKITSNSSNIRGALIKWDLSSIPNKAVITSAAMKLNVSTGASQTYNLYSLRRSWVEGTLSTGANSSTSANWETYDGSHAWGAGGAASTSSDRYDTNLWGADSTTFASSGSKTVALNASGVAVIQDWVNGTTPNYGLTIQNYVSGDANDGISVSSSENSTPANRPTLNVSYCAITGPAIVISGTLNAFTTPQGVASEAQTYTVSGLNLTEAMVVTAPEGFELSLDNITYNPSLTLPQTSGAVAATTVYVRLSGDDMGGQSGSVIHTSSGATQVDLAVIGTVARYYNLTISPASNGSVTLDPAGGSYAEGTVVTLTATASSGFVFDSWSGDLTSSANPATITMNADKAVTPNFVTATCTTTSLVAAEDTYLSAYNKDYNYGGVDQFKVTTDSTTNRGTLIKWDLSSIPNNAVITSAAMKLNVITAASQTYNLYNMRQSWVEGTATSGTTSDTSANWETYDGSHTWGAGGAASTSSDRYDTNLWGADSSTFASTGSKTVALNASGAAVIQGWVNGALPNYGLTLQNYVAGSTDGGVVISSSENTTPANRPVLDVTHCIAATGPTISTMGTLSAFTTPQNVASAAQTYTVSGINLTGDISISAPTGFELSTDGSSYSASLTLPQLDGAVASTPIYVRLNSGTLGAHSGSIAHTSSGATQKNLAVSGTVTNDNIAPATPVLKEPADDAPAVSISPELKVTVSDPNPGDTLDVSFYGRPVAGTSGQDFTLVFIPDAQGESEFNPAMFKAQTTWIKDHKVDNNIVFVTNAGDLVNDPASATQYQNADAAVDILDAGGVWYTMAPGNHDTYGSTLYPNYFGPSRYANYKYADGHWFGGSYDDYSSYSLFSASGNDFILINLRPAPSQAVLDWADGLLTTYSNRRAIVEEHDILNVDNSWNNQASYTALRDHANLFLMLCGHMHDNSDGAAYLAGTGTDGHTIHIVQADYQDMNYGNGNLRLLRFSPANDLIYMTTYSPYTGESRTESPDQMDLAYDLAGSSTVFELIGKAEDVANGGTASVTWSGLSANKAYEWYASASDGSAVTESPVWSFTTGTATNQAPVITEGASKDVSMSEDGAPTAFSLTLNATDGNNDTLTWSISTGASHGTASASGTGASKAISYAPTANQSGTDSFVVQVSDGKGGTDSITVNVTINAVNDAPVITGQKTLTTAEDTALTLTLSDLTVTDVDNTYPTGFSLAVQAGSNYALSGNTITPAANFTGDLTVLVKVSDGAAESATYNLTVTVTATNDAPVITEGDSKDVSMSEDGTPTAFSLTLNATDADNDTLTWSISTGVTNGTASASGTGASKAISYAPTANYNGADSFVVQVSDGKGGTDTITVNVTIQPVNDAPVAVNDAYKTSQDTALSVDAAAGVLHNDTDLDSDALTASLVNNVTNGTLALSSDGSFTYTPATGWTGTDSFTYNAKDSADTSAPATVSIEVTGSIVVPPIPSSFHGEIHFSATLPSVGDNVEAYVPGATEPVTTTAITQESSDLKYLIDVKGDTSETSEKDGGVEGDPITFKIKGQVVATGVWHTGTSVELNIHPPQPVAGGPYTGVTGTAINFSGSANDWGNDAASYQWDWENDGVYDATVPNPSHAWSAVGTYTAGLKVTDAQGGVGVTTVTVTVANDTPVLALIGNQHVAEGTPLAFTATAKDSNPLTYSLGGAPVGAAINAASGAFTWTPAEDQGPDDYNFTIKVCDNADPALCDEESITVSVSEVNLAPELAGIGNKSVVELATLSFTASATDADLPANTLTYSLDSAPNGATIDAASGAFTWTPTADQGPNTYTFYVKVCDNGGDGATSLCDQEEIIVTVSASTSTHSIALIPGWNLVSFNLHPVDTGIANVLASVSGNYDLVYAWDASGASASSGNWKKYVPGSEPYQNSLSALDETMGFWVHMTAADTLEVSGTAPNTTSIALSKQAGGWNLVGYPSAGDRTLPEALSNNGVNENFTLVYAYHAADTGDTWKLFDREADAWANDLKATTPGWGYWIYVSADSPWTVGYSLP